MKTRSKTSNFKFQISNSSLGSSLVELLIAMGLASIILPALLTGFATSRAGRAQSDQRLASLFYLKEAQEAARTIRDTNWTSFAVDGTYHPVISGSNWTLAANSETINGFIRSIVIGDVYRDTNGNIVSSGGTLDPSTKKVDITVSWSTPIASNVSSTIYLARFTNRVHTDTTVADFTPGLSNSATTGVTITNNSGGEVALSQGGSSGGDWCKPTKIAAVTYDLPGQGVTTAISAIPGHAYTTTGFNASGHSMDSVSISDPQSPPPVVSSGGYYDNYKTYGIFANSNYIYLASNHPHLTVDVINAQSPYTQQATFQDSGGETGTSVYVSGNTGFVTAGSKLYSFNTTNVSGSLTQLGSIALNGTGNRVMVVGSYAYVATSSTSNQLQIINVSNPSNMSVVNSVSMGNSLAGVDVFVNSSGTLAYLVTTYSAGKSDFFIIDLSSNPPKVRGTYSTSGMTPKGVVAVGGNRAIIVGSGGQLYQVLDTSEIDEPESCGSMNPSGATSVNAVAAVSEADGDAFAYILTDNSNAEFQIITGGPGGNSFNSSGTFESQTFDAGSQVMFNGFSATTSTPPQTSITYQFGITQAVNNSCSNVNFTFVGPTGQTNSFFTTGGQIPAGSGPSYFNPGQCLRYRAYFTTTDQTQTPVIYDMNINYSP